MTKGNDLRILPFDQLPEWDGFVESHVKGTIYHTSAMIRTMALTKGNSPFSHAAVDQSGRICAMLVAVKVSTLGRWADPFAARSIFYAEPIYLNTIDGQNGVMQLVRHHDRYMRGRTLFAEVRPFYAPPVEDDPLLKENYELLGYFNYEFNLLEPEEQLFMRLDPTCRKKIRSSKRRGLIVREVEPLSELNIFYSMVSESYRGSKVPLADRSHFESAFREMPPPISRLFIAEYEGDVAAAACFLAYKGRVVYWYAGTKRIQGIAAASVILWDAIAKYSSEGFHLMDLAGAGWEGEKYGPGEFKSRFGGVLTNYGRYRKVYSAWKLQSASFAYKIMRSWISP